MVELEKYFVYRVQENDTINSICKTFNTTKENILRNNNIIPLYVGECLEITVNDYKTHIVKPTETLEFIADLYSVNVEKIMESNKLNNSKLYIGQILKIY